MIPVHEVRIWLGVGSSEDGTIDRLIELATAALGRELGGLWLGEPTDRVEVLCGRGHVTLTLDQTPTGSTLVVETRLTPFEGWAVVDDGDWALDRWYLTHRTGWPYGRGTIRVTYPVGWACGKGPRELQAIVRELVTTAYATKSGALTSGFTSESLGDYSYTRGDIERTASWSAVARQWRRMRA